MPEYELDLHLLLSELDSGDTLGEALFFPEVSRLSDRPSTAEDGLVASARDILEHSPASEMFRRHPAGKPELGEVRVEIEAPSGPVVWTEALCMRFDVLHWQHGEEACLAYLPALGIEVIDTDRAEIEGRLEKEVRGALFRLGVLESLPKLAMLQRTQKIHLTTRQSRVKLVSPRAQAKRLEGDKPSKPIIDQVGVDLGELPLARAYELDELTARMADTLVGKRSSSLLLVGPSGVGKTAAVHELVRRRRVLGLHRTPFWSTSGSRLVAGMSGFGMWQERCAQLVSEARKSSAILHLGNLVELMEVGKSEHNSQGIASFFRPHLQRGELLVIAECSPEQLPLIEQQEPHLLQAFTTLQVEEPDKETGRAILFSCAADWERKLGGSLTPEALECLDRLHRRHAAYSAYPGRPLRFLENLMMEAEHGQRIDEAAVVAAFARHTGLPLFMLDDRERLDLNAARAWFDERVMGQSAGVSRVVDLLAAAKTDLGRPGKPLGTLLFIGPTGVGKTELAKTLASYLFGDEERLVRFDMSEYSDPYAVLRLTGGPNRSEGLLTAQVREQPFCVVLLDEIEKAHPLFFDLLLQVLGEARLTDAWGRVSDFSNAVVIMTSNLGSEAFSREPLGFGADAGAAAIAMAQVHTAVRDFFRPELVNRIDSIVPFGLLSPEALLAITRRQLDLVRQRDGLLFRGVKLDLTEAAIELLAERGFDQRYGARPLRRRLERDVLAPLADGLNAAGAGHALEASVDTGDGILKVEVRPKKEKSSQPEAGLFGSSDEIEQTIAVCELRRFAQQVHRGAALFSLTNEITRLERQKLRMERRRVRGRKVRPRDLAGLERLPELLSVSKELQQAWQALCDLEDEVLLDLYGRKRADTRPVARLCQQHADVWEEVLVSLYRLRFSQPDKLSLGLFSEHPKALFELARAYLGAISAQDKAKIGLVQWRLASAGAGGKDATPEDPKASKVGPVRRLTVKKPKLFLENAQPGVLGLVFTIEHRAAYCRWFEESGLCKLGSGSAQKGVLVHTSEALGADYRSPAGIARRGAIGDQPLRRVIDLDRSEIVDKLANLRVVIRGRKLDAALAEIVNSAFRARLIEAACS